MLVINLDVIKSFDPSAGLYRLVRWILAGLFLWAGFLKLADPQAFAVVIRDFGLIPEWSSLPLAVLLPAVEVAAAIGLLFDVRGSLAVITALLVLFIAILGYGIWLGLDIDCGCFGPEDPESKTYHGLRSALYRDLMMAGAIGYLYWWRYSNITGLQLRTLKRSI